MGKGHLACETSHIYDCTTHFSGFLCILQIGLQPKRFSSSLSEWLLYTLLSSIADTNAWDYTQGMQGVTSFPGHSHLQYLHTANDLILEVGTACERGYQAGLNKVNFHYDRPNGRLLRSASRANNSCTKFLPEFQKDNKFTLYVQCMVTKNIRDYDI